ncbi:prepilin-type N-terminal cleavage/methylation domain-containing protein [candidate division WWE3 bacterium]|nr:prepilin-type N-terminal cleavage/methylation domain-containing protein [candidate division WWE3 bacterium]MBT7349202.1 prepilin-type N-terminal cleavage/methylation domain-containing protein [candidate division WWE3 bacterium]
MIKQNKGFTLIELLIVIVIIGILAGVLISVIDPVSQQNRARDAGIEASINKVVLATEGYISAYGNVPTEVQFVAQFKTATITPRGTSCDQTTGDPDCEFSVVGNALSETCSSTWAGSGTSQCYFRYSATDGTSSFVIYAKSAGLADVVFKFENSGSNTGVIQQCPASDPVSC